MQELSLYILDITMNGVKAGAAKISITIKENGPLMDICIADNGCGMSPETVEKLKDPFFTTRTTRKVGMGVPLFTEMAQQTGGDVTVKSIEAPAEGHGTVIEGTFHTDSIDCVPLGDVSSTLTTLIQGSPDIDFVFTHSAPDRGLNVELDTETIRSELDGVPLNTPAVLEWIREYVDEQYAGSGKEGKL